VLNSGGGEAQFTIPDLPAPSGDTLLAQLESAMNALSAYQVSEVLNSGTGIVQDTFSADVPDRESWTINQTSRTIWIGKTFYTQEAPGDPWHEEESVTANTVPYFVWDQFKPLTNAHVIGQEMLDGVPTTVVASFGNAIATPIWFTFWVEATGRVRQVTMDAPEHFMTDTYTSYNKPVEIVPPTA